MGCGSSKSTSTSLPSQHKKCDHDGIPERDEKKNYISASKQSNSPKQVKPTDVSQPCIVSNNNQNSEQNQCHQLTPKDSTTHTDQETPDNRSHSLQEDAVSRLKEKSHATNAVAFEVPLGEHSRLRELRRPPKLQKLDHLPLLTAEMLAKKQALAEENRQKEIQKKLAKISKRKKQLLEARELDIKAQEKRSEMEEKMNAQNRKRSKIQAEIVEKQRRRELRAKRVREKAKMIQDGGDMVGFEVDRDETYNADEEDDIWDIQPNNEIHHNNPTSISSHTDLQSRPYSDDEQPQDPKSVHDFFEE